MDDFEKLNLDLTKHQHHMLVLLERAEKEARESGNKAFLVFVESEKTKIHSSFTTLSKTAASLSTSLQATLDTHTQELEKEIEKLNKMKDTLLSDNMLLEYKKKDLLQLTSSLEEANESIINKNKELIIRQEEITAQAKRLESIHEEIVEKHRELERQKEALLDQSDYLHEANETITSMHAEVQKQKNEILQKNEELLSLNNEKNNLIGIVAHDLKSPLNQMKGLLNVIRMSSSTLDKDTVSCLDMMEKSADRLTNLIAKILDVEAIESKQLNLILEPTNVSDVVESLTDRFRKAASEKSILLHANVAPGLIANTDKVYTSQVFENLISNAIKFSPPYKNIYISLYQTENEIIGEIRDEGPGLTEEDKRKLFGKYQKLSARPTGNESSSGLGLSIVKKFIEAMHGRIWCESEAGNGASFNVAFQRVVVEKNSLVLDEVSSEKQ
jgi:signal transduction histidine kinase